MGTLIAQAIIDKAEGILQDTTNITWLEADHLINLNDGIRKICEFKPDAYITIAAVQLAAGTRQSAPSGAKEILDISCNMGVAGTTRGDVITLVDRAVMNAALPGWNSVTASPTVIHWMYDVKDPKVFYVYPPQPTSAMGYVEMECMSTPAAILIGAAIPIDDGNENALLNFLLYRAWLKKQPAQAAGYWTLFLADLGITDQAEDKNDANQKPIKGGTP
jgi:hypothetical protein